MSLQIALAWITMTIEIWKGGDNRSVSLVCRSIVKNIPILGLRHSDGWKYQLVRVSRWKAMLVIANIGKCPIEASSWISWLKKVKVKENHIIAHLWRLAQKEDLQKLFLVYWYSLYQGDECKVSRRKIMWAWLEDRCMRSDKLVSDEAGVVWFSDVDIRPFFRVRGGFAVLVNP